MEDEAEQSNGSTSDSEPKRKKPVNKKYSHKTPVIHMPQEIYDETRQEIEKLCEQKPKEPKVRSKGLEYVERSAEPKCHKTSHASFNTITPSMCAVNLLEATRQAFEDRNFPAVYQLVEIGFEIFDPLDRFLTSQLTQHLLHALEIDPAIPNREEFFMNVVKGLYGLEENFDPSDFRATKFHLLKKREEAEEEGDMKDQSGNANSDNDD